MKIECPIYDYKCPYWNGGNCMIKEMEGTDYHEKCNVFFDMDEDYEMGFDPYLGCYTDDC